MGDSKNQLKDGAILLGWIAGLVIVASLIWFPTQPFRSGLLLKNVNRVLEEYGDNRRLGESVSPGWYTMTRTDPAAAGSFYEGRKIYIFTFIGEGTFFPCAAVVAPGGTVEEFIALNNYGGKILKQIPPEVLKIYTRRIEGKRS